MAARAEARGPHAGDGTVIAARAAVAVDDIAAALQARATRERRDWWTRYLKEAAVFRGVAMADVRGAVREAWSRELSASPDDLRREVVTQLLHRRATEDKLAGILVLAEHMLGGLSPIDLPWLREPFFDGAVADWNVCDWHAVKVLGALCARDGRAFSEPLAAWAGDGPVWQRRAPAVALASILARPGHAAAHGAVAVALCERLVADDARFAQTAVGWLLRELSRADPALTISFVEKHFQQMSNEARRMATARLRGAGRR